VLTSRTTGPQSCLTRRALRLLIASIALWLGSAHQAHAQSWEFSPFWAIKFAGGTTLFDLADQSTERHFTYGGSVRYIGQGLFGVEGDFGDTPDFFGEQTLLVTSSRVTTLMGNVVIAAPLSLTGDSLRPYASGGFGAMWVRVATALSPLDIRRTLPAWNIGGGAQGFITRRVGVRWDLRYLRGSGGGGDSVVSFGSQRLSFWRASMGLVIR
jgi:hypothetical protein